MEEVKGFLFSIKEKKLYLVFFLVFFLKGDQVEPMSNLAIYFLEMASH